MGRKVNEEGLEGVLLGVSTVACKGGWLAEGGMR